MKRGSPGLETGDLDLRAPHRCLGLGQSLNLLNLVFLLPPFFNDGTTLQDWHLDKIRCEMPAVYFSWLYSSQSIGLLSSFVN